MTYFARISLKCKERCGHCPVNSEIIICVWALYFLDVLLSTAYHQSPSDNSATNKSVSVTCGGVGRTSTRRVYHR